MAKITYVPLHGHSYFSVLDGLASPEDIVKTAKDIGSPAVALTDHGTCAGLFRFNKACKDIGIKPILGMEAYYVDYSVDLKEKGERRWHVTLWAKNKTGYRNLLKLSTIAYERGFYYKPRIDWDILKQNSEGLMVGSGCVTGIICGPILEGDEVMAERLTEKFHSHFGEDFYIEIMFHTYFPAYKESKEAPFMEAMKKVFRVAKQHKIKMIYTHDSHYCLKKEAKAHDVLLSIQTLNTVKNPNRLSFHANDFYIKTPEELVRKLKGKVDHTYLLENTLHLAEKVEEDLIEIHEPKELLPVFPVPDGVESEESYLAMLIEEGMRGKGLLDDPDYKTRMKYELDVIYTCGYTRYFLILWDIIAYANRVGIRVGPGRGSGVSSLCLYCLGITALDPIKYDLSFDRFLNPERVSPPDVDMDFDRDRQDDIFRYVADKYGHENTARIGTTGTLQTKDAIKRVGKALDIGCDWEHADEKDKQKKSWKTGRQTLQLVDRISKCIPTMPDSSVKWAIKSCQELKPYIKLYPEVFELAQIIEGTVSNEGVHAAGVLISNSPIVKHVPLRVSKERILCSQYNMHEVEEIGLLKYDFLALNNLTLIEHCVNLVEERRGIRVDTNALEPNEKKVFEILNRGFTEGLFQFEGAKITDLLRRIHVDSFDDMVVAVAMYRPGVLQSGLHEDYVRYKHGQKEVTYLHPMMKEVLGETYGIMCLGPSQGIWTEKGTIDIADYNNGKILHYENRSIKQSSPSVQPFVTGRRQLYAYKLSNGFKIVCTPDHKFLAVDGVYYPIDHLFKNSIAIPWVQEGDFLDHDKLLEDEELKKLYLFGALIGDGCLTQTTPVLCCGKSEEYAEKISSLFKQVYGGDAHKFWHCRSWYLSLGFNENKHRFGPKKCNRLLDELRCLCAVKKSKEKRILLDKIPAMREAYLAFLAGVVDTDGCISNDIFITSVSDLLLQDLSLMLGRLGFHCYLSGFQLHVYESVDLYKSLKKYLIKKKKVAVPTCNGSSLRISSQGASLLIDADRKGRSLRSYCRETNLSRTTLQSILSGKRPLCKISSLFKRFRKSQLLKNSALCIVSKERLLVEDVYDLTMPDNTSHNFILPPGVVAHNCYQEQVMKVAMEMASFTASEADTFRKGMGKKKPEIIAALQAPFVKGCVDNDVDKVTAEKVFELCSYFGGYGFNKSHAAAYAHLAYQTAYLKRFYPMEFMCCLLSSAITNTDKLVRYERECYRMKITIHKPDVNKSKAEYVIEGPRTLRKPLAAVKGIGEKAVEVIVRNQPYNSVEEFVNKIDHRVVNTRVFSIIVEEGYMQCFGIAKKDILLQYEDAKEKRKKEKSKAQREAKKVEKKDRLNLFGVDL